MESGDVLLSRAVSSQVPSALRGLTSVFGMGTGGSLLPLSPEILYSVVDFFPHPENRTVKVDLKLFLQLLFASSACLAFAWLAFPLRALTPLSDQALDRLVSASSHITALSPLTYLPYRL